MAYSYLLSLYKVLDKRKKEIEMQMQKNAGVPEQEQYQRGRLAAITGFTTFLQENYHQKLPRRLQQQRQ